MASVGGEPSTDTLEKLRANFDAWKGPITEATLRHTIAQNKGPGWARSVRFKSLGEVVKWVGRGIQADDGQMDKAMEKIKNLFIKGFEGFDADGTAIVCHPDSITTNTQQGDCAYSALQNWSKAAKAAPGYRNSTFSTYAKSLHLALSDQRREWKLAKEAEEQASFFGTDDILKKVQTNRLSEQIMHRDQQVGFILLWAILEPAGLQSITGSFDKFSIPCMEIEIDHAGCFKNLPNGEVMYEGGETKASATDMQPFLVLCANLTSGSRSPSPTREEIPNGGCRFGTRLWTQRYVFWTCFHPKTRR